MFKILIVLFLALPAQSAEEITFNGKTFFGPPLLDSNGKDTKKNVNLPCLENATLRVVSDAQKISQVCVLKSDPNIKNGLFETRDLKTFRVTESGYFKNNLPHGKVKIDDGQMIAESVFKDGIRLKNVVYHPFVPTQILSETVYSLDGKKLLKTKYFDRAGKVATEQAFKKEVALFQQQSVGRILILSIYAAMQAYRAEYTHYSSDLWAAGFEPKETLNYLCGFSKPSTRTKNEYLSDFNSNRHITTSPDFLSSMEKKLGYKTRYNGLATIQDFPVATVTDQTFLATCVARYPDFVDVWTIDQNKTIRHQMKPNKSKPAV